MRSKTPSFFDKIILKRFQGKKTIYILPTKEGYYYIATCFITFLIGMGYNNNLGIMASFIMTAYLSIIMLQSNNSLKYLSIDSIKIIPGFADQRLETQVIFSSNSNKETHFVTIYGGNNFQYSINFIKKVQPFIIRDSQSSTITLKRGYYHFNIFKIVCTGPNHLFKTWCYQKTNCEFFVYPFRVIDQDILMLINRGHKNNDLDEDFYETHIPYLIGMNPKRLDWKYFAKSEKLLWKKFNAYNSQSLKLNYHSFKGSDEEKLSKLSWAIDYCHKHHIVFDLVLPSKTFLNQKSPENIRECLEELAKV